jgi:EAL domain-containing protein (putative c-di-GMP-specific phosphodiesterase class I)
MLEIGRALDLDVVAEGIETPDQLRLLRELGCGLGQGFLFARPVPASELPQVARSLGGGGS